MAEGNERDVNKHKAGYGDTCLSCQHSERKRKRDL